MVEIILRECKYHGLTEYAKSSNGVWRCKKCRAEHVIARRNKVKQTLVDYKGGKCEICGYDKCLDALEFHHLNPEEKEFNLSHSNSKSMEKSKEEADKCILVCSNCHRELHAAMKKERIKYKPRELDKETINQIKELSSTHIMADIAKKLNVSKSTVSRILQENNIIPLRNINPLSEFTYEQFIESYKRNKSLIKVGKEFNVSDNAIRKWLKKNGYGFSSKELKKLL